SEHCPACKPGQGHRPPCEANAGTPVCAGYACEWPEIRSIHDHFPEPKCETCGHRDICHREPS
ncbi:MAG TPA: hypothetical protein VNA25_29335, partial [Phycisphaerae bacterium]|nr:hypothetical protein [Phycisphaerae bacterium]